MLSSPTVAEQLLLGVIRGDWDGARRLSRGSALDPATLLAVCRAADVHPWVHQRLSTADGAAIVGTAALTALGAARERVRRDNLLLLARAEEALELLRRVGVTPIALKGLDFLHRIYTAFDQRTIDDVDLLVRREDLAPCVRALVEAGWRLPGEAQSLHYVRSSHHLPLVAPGPIGVAFELHWNLAQAGRFRVDPRRLFERSVPLAIGGVAVRRLGDDDVVAHLLLHHFTHYFDRRLKWLVDLGQLEDAGGVQWERVLETVDAWGARAAAAAALRHLAKLDPRRIPDTVLAALPLAGWRRLLAWPLRSTEPLELWRGTRRRAVQIYLAALLLDRPAALPAWWLHRRARDRRRSDHPLEALVRELAAPARQAS